MSGGPARVMQGGRAKAYRPLPATDRQVAFRAGLAAYEAGQFFEAHELLEPAWMGTADVAERDLHQGLIKLAAAYVHAERGNPLGMAKNLAGARQRLAAALAADVDQRGLDVTAIVRDVDQRLERLERLAGPDGLEVDWDTAGIGPPPLHRRNP